MNCQRVSLLGVALPRALIGTILSKCGNGLIGYFPEIAEGLSYNLFFRIKLV